MSIMLLHNVIVVSQSNFFSLRAAVRRCWLSNPHGPYLHSTTPSPYGNITISEAIPVGPFLQQGGWLTISPLLATHSLPHSQSCCLPCSADGKWQKKANPPHFSPRNGPKSGIENRGKGAAEVTFPNRVMVKMKCNDSDQQLCFLFPVSLKGWEELWVLRIAQAASNSGLEKRFSVESLSVA